MRPADAPVVIDALNRWEVTEWLTRVPFPYAQADFDWFLAEMCNDPDDHVWAIERDGQMVGCISSGGELGYWLHPDHHGVGVMSEAATCVCDWHFAQKDADMFSGYHLGNGPSSAVLGKLGFRTTRVDRGVETARGDKVDIQRVSLTCQRWKAQTDG